MPDYNKPSRFRPDPPKGNVTWLKPELVAEISYREMTKDGILRHPSFKGLREDKSAKEVVRETTHRYRSSDAGKQIIGFEKNDSRARQTGTTNPAESKR